MWPFISYLVMAQPLPSSCFYEVSIHRGETFQPEAHLSPASDVLSFPICKTKKENEKKKLLNVPL